MPEAIIIGAGPAGLTAAYELLTTTDIKPVVIEQDGQVGGLARTINYKGNRIDIGGHRFFSKSEKVLNWWLQFLPLEQGRGDAMELHYQQRKTRFSNSGQKEGQGDRVMLVRERKSRIYHDHHFYDYPLKINWNTVKNLGTRRLARITASYASAKLQPITPEVSLEDFFINRFGHELYLTFFKDYTEKVWGVACKDMPATWGYQRIKDLNIAKAVWDAVTSPFRRDRSIHQKTKSTSLIEQFLYPQYGPGQLWEAVAEEVERLGGKILLNTEVETFQCNGGNSIDSVVIKNRVTGERTCLPADYVLSSMPVPALVDKLRDCVVPPEVLEVAKGLQYRDFLIVGLLVEPLNRREGDAIFAPDNWIYLQDRAIKAGRLQLFHNWSPGMVADPGKKWLGVEYFCNESDPFWQLPDEAIQAKATDELTFMGLITQEEVVDGVVIRVKKAYPSYHGSFDQFDVLQSWLNGFGNLFLMGRNGMHRYNNMDHSMLTAMAAVEHIRTSGGDKTAIWEINTEREYHEESREA